MDGATNWLSAVGVSRGTWRLGTVSVTTDPWWTRDGCDRRWACCMAPAVWREDRELSWTKGQEAGLLEEKQTSQLAEFGNGSDIVTLRLGR